MSNYPSGAQYDSNAPYNQEEREIEVTAFVTLSRPLTVKVSGEDYDLEDIVRELIHLPQDSFPEWEVDCFNVIEE